MSENNLIIESSPQIKQFDSTRSVMWAVSLCLLPAGTWAVWVFGLRVLAVLFASILAAVIAEAAISFILKRNTLMDGSAFLTGLLIGFNMPPSIPYYIPVVASIFAIVVVKWAFGGLGGNFMNPALAGRVFVFFSWTGPMTRWSMPKTLPTIDALSSATPLGYLKSGLLEYTGNIDGPARFLAETAYPHTNLDSGITSWLNANMGFNLSEGYIDMFLGNIPGSIGEISVLLLLLGSIYLFARKIITWEIPVSFIVSFGLLIWIFGGTRYSGGAYFNGDVLFHLFTGGLVLGVIYMATDMVTSPHTRRGMLIYGIGAGVLTFMIRIYGSFPEGVSLAIILMNIFVPMIDQYTKPKRFGIQSKKEEK
jgi:H+/Na+-translocating ferredoxin:NAD+ oxidoreductase subunit D